MLKNGNEELLNKMIESNRKLSSELKKKAMNKKELDFNQEKETSERPKVLEVI